MKTVMVNSINSRVSGFPYQLVKWQKLRDHIESFLYTFKKYRKEHKGIIVEAPEGFSIFTTGEGIPKCPQSMYLQRQRVKEERRRKHAESEK